MVGGRSPELTDEVIYSFEFPDRPGALMNFLNKLGQNWNISMFHYRNHGSAYGQVLAGLQVPLNEREDLQEALISLNYRFKEENDNPAYKHFLK